MSELEQMTAALNGLQRAIKSLDAKLEEVKERLDVQDGNDRLPDMLPSAKNRYGRRKTALRQTKWCV